MEYKKAVGFSGNLYLAVSLLGLCLVVSTNMQNFVCRLQLPSPARVWTRIAHRSKVTGCSFEDARRGEYCDTLRHGLRSFQDLLQVWSFAHHLDHLSL